MLLLVLFLALLQSLSAAQPAQPTGWQVVGQIGGPTQAVAVQGNYAYVGVGLRLVVLNVTDPVTLTEVGTTAPFPYFVEDIAISGTRAYVAAGGAGLRVVDVSDPANPTEIGAWDSPGYAEGVAVSGKTVYLADGPYGLRAVDVSEPTNPIPLGAAFDMNYAFEVAVSGDYAYVAAAGAGLLIADVSDPAHPAEVGTLDTPGYAYGVAVAGTVACIADGWAGLRFVDIADPQVPAEIGLYQTPGWVLSLAISGTMAFTADTVGGMQILDLSDPAQPQVMGRCEAVRSHAGSTAVAGQMVYVADRLWGVRIVDAADLEAPIQVGAYHSTMYADALAVGGDYAYVGSPDHGLRVVDVSNPAQPVETGNYAIDAAVSSVAAVGDTVYAVTLESGAPENGLHVFNVSNPANPSRIGFLPRGSGVRDIAVVSDIVYPVDEWTLSLVSVTNPTVPVPLGSIQLAEPGGADIAVGVTVSGTLAYVASEPAGLEIIDASDPEAPAWLSGLAGPSSYAEDVAVAGNNVYLADGSGLRIIDVSDPLHPTELGYGDSVGEALSVLVSGTTAYVSNGGMGLALMDASDPAHPFLATVLDTQGIVQGAVTSGGRLYVADGPNGLLILEPTAATWPAAPSSFSRVVRDDRGQSKPQRKAWAGVELPAPAYTRGDPQTGTDGQASGAGASCNVTSPADSGPGTLRACLEGAAEGDMIVFDPTVFLPPGPVTITLASPLPALEQGQLTIDASDAGVILDGRHTPAGTNGLVLGSDGNTIHGLQILFFPMHGILVHDGARYNLIGGDRDQGSGPQGQGNLISGNGTNGIVIVGAETMSNTVTGNWIGIDATGAGALPNGGPGGGIHVWSPANRIGGENVGERNVVSGNAEDGIVLQGTEAIGNRIVGNYVGTDATGSLALGNRGIGIAIVGGAANNLVQGNVSSGNGGTGVQICDWGGNYNRVSGNRIGTDASGEQLIPNGGFGIQVCWSASFNLLGGTEENDRNLIDGSMHGITIDGKNTWGNLILGNWIGLAAGGAQALGNTVTGIAMANGGHTWVGGATTQERNVVSGNGWIGIEQGEDYGYISGNLVGTDASGAGPLPNGWAGVNVWLGIEHSTVQGNRIAYNATNGVSVGRSQFITLRRNEIHGHPGQGILLTDGSNQNIQPPVILAVTETTVSGMACPGCTVEIFSDDEDEGRIYEGTVIADATGHFGFDKGSPLAGPYLTATATDRQGNTSEFSVPVARLAQLYLPLVLKSH
jgi:hypothetical protein